MKTHLQHPLDQKFIFRFSSKKIISVENSVQLSQIQKNVFNPWYSFIVKYIFLLSFEHSSDVFNIKNNTIYVHTQHTVLYVCRYIKFC